MVKLASGTKDHSHDTLVADTAGAARMPTPLNATFEGANMVPHHILAVVLIVTDDVFLLSRLDIGRFVVDGFRGSPFRKSKNCIAIMAAERVQFEP